MRELKATKINAADFAPFGTFFSMTEPEGYPLQGEIHKFYPDRISGTCMGSIGFSPIAVHKDERIVKAAEYHTTTWEGIVALDDDMIIHVAPASAGAPVPELTRAFIVPKGTMVKITVISDKCSKNRYQCRKCNHNSGQQCIWQSKQCHRDYKHCSKDQSLHALSRQKTRKCLIRQSQHFQYSFCSPLPDKRK